MSVTVTLVFETEEAKRHFMGGLSDGFGENACDLQWPHDEGVLFDEADAFLVTPFDREGNSVGSPMWAAENDEDPSPLPTVEGEGR